MVCVLCNGQGFFNAFGACGEDEKKGVCPLCQGSKVSPAGLTVKCTPCDGKSGTGAFGPTLPFDTHFRVACLACEGHGYHPTGTILTPCAPCGGQGAEGAFGNCTPGDTNVKSLCETCHGKGCTITHAVEHKTPAPTPAATIPAPTPTVASTEVDHSSEESPPSVIKIAAKFYFYHEGDRVFSGRTLFNPVYAGHQISRFALAAEDFDAKELGFEYKAAIFGLTSTNYTHNYDDKAFRTYPEFTGESDHGIRGVNIRLIGKKAPEYHVRYQISTNGTAGNWSPMAHDGLWLRVKQNESVSRLKIWVEKRAK